MKLIVAVLIVKAIIRLFEKNKKTDMPVNENRGNGIHPAAFRIRD